MKNWRWQTLVALALASLVLGGIAAQAGDGAT